jgi:hypothetical protein
VTIGFRATLNGDLTLSFPSLNPFAWADAVNGYVTVETGGTIEVLCAGVGALASVTYDEREVNAHAALDFLLPGLAAEYKFGVPQDESWSDRRDQISGTPGTPMYLGDKHVSSELVGQYVCSCASGDLQKCARILVTGCNGVAITGDVKRYPDAILRNQAGHEGGTGSGSTSKSSSSTAAKTKQDSYADKCSGSGGGGSKRRIQHIIGLAFLAPDIVRDVVDGRQPMGFTSDWCKRRGLPSDWAEQRVLLATL